METKQKRGYALANAAVKALTANGYPKRRNNCQKWARLVTESIHGKRFAALMHKPTAKDAALSFVADGRFVVPISRGSAVGDLLYKTSGSGGAGHVGIRVAGNRVAENSSAHIDGANDTDARGLRSLAEFGAFDVIVRLPEPTQTK